MTELTNERALYEATINKREQNNDAWRVWQAARCTQPADCAEGLGPLPKPNVHRTGDIFGEPTAYTAEQVEQIRREAYEAGKTGKHNNP